MSASTAISLDSLVCSRCGMGLKRGFLGIGSPLAQLKEATGRCPECRGDRFKAVFTVKRSFTEGLSAGNIALAAFVSFLTCGSFVFIPRISSGEHQSSFTLLGVEGATILEKMELPPQAAIDWIVSTMKEGLKANLRPDQGICLQCEEIFVRGFGGYTTEGYCSPNCKMMHQEPPQRVVAQYAAAPVPAPSAKSMDCPHCGRNINVKPGGGKCMYCGKVVQV